MKTIKYILILLFILIILSLFFIFCFCHNKIYYLKFDKENNEYIGFHKFEGKKGQYYMRIGFPSIFQTLNKGVSVISRDGDNQKTNLVACDLYIINYDKNMNLKIKKIVLLITDLKTNQVIDAKEIYLNNEELTSNCKNVVDQQINFENIDHNKYNDFYHIYYYYDDFTNMINEINLSIDLVWEYDNKTYSYSNEYLIKKKWYGLDLNIDLN